MYKIVLDLILFLINIRQFLELASIFLLFFSPCYAIKYKKSVMLLFELTPYEARFESPVLRGCVLQRDGLGECSERSIWRRRRKRVLLPKVPCQKGSDTCLKKIPWKKVSKEYILGTNPPKIFKRGDKRNC